MDWERAVEGAMSCADWLSGVDPTRIFHHPQHLTLTTKAATRNPRLTFLVTRINPYLQISADSPPLLRAARQLRRTRQHNAELSLSLISICFHKTQISRLSQCGLVSNDE
jgi:hypothetical protein